MKETLVNILSLFIFIIIIIILINMINNIEQFNDKICGGYCKSSLDCNNNMKCIENKCCYY